MKRKVMHNSLLGFLFSTLVTVSLLGQEGEITNHIFEGNTQVAEESYSKAEKAYRKALSLAPETPTALYNLGNTHYRDKQLDEASQRFFQTQKFATEKEDKHRAFHNMGNVFMKKKEYEKAVEAYKNALRNDPSDEETRYNYALAKELLEKEQQNQDQDDQQDKDQKDDQDKKDQEQEEDQDKEGDQEKDDKKEPEEEGDEGDKKDQEGDPEKEGDDPKEEKPKDQEEGDQEPSDKKQPPQPRPGQLSPQQVKSLLEAMNNQEKKVQDKVNAEKAKGVPLRGKKDW